MNIFLWITKYNILEIQWQFPTQAFLLKTQKGFLKTTAKWTPAHLESYPRSWLCVKLLVLLVGIKMLLLFWLAPPSCRTFKTSFTTSLPQAPTPLLPHLRGPHDFPDWCSWQPRAAYDNNCDTRFSSEVVDSLKRKHCILLENKVDPALNVSIT